MDFIQFIHIDEIKNLQSNGKKYIFFQLITTLNKYVHINIDIYVQYVITNKEYKNFTIEKLVEKFIEQPIYIGELVSFTKKFQKTYNDTINMVRDISNEKRLVYYKELFQTNLQNLYYVNNIDDFVVISFIRL